MHVVFFADQHLDSLGGAQVSMRLQRTFLERAGHTVTVVAPRMHARRDDAASSPGNVDLPSLPITLDREYAMTWPGRATDRALDRAMAHRPPVDLVHVQADFWGAFIGHRFAARHGIPVVHTMHNRVDVGLAAVTPLHRPVLAVLNLWRRTALRGIGVPVGGSDGWSYLRGLAADAAAVTAPSGHFARRLEQNGVARTVDVVWNGIDDDVRAQTLAAAPVERMPGRPRFVWLGRMSPEKRLLPFLRAWVDADIDADLEVIGGGGERAAAERIVAGRAGVRFAGRLSYAQTLERIAAADALVQTSIGFETQGMTPFEAATLGTPSVVCDPDIAAELQGGLWAVPTAEPHARGRALEAQRIEALAATLRQAAADIAHGTAPQPVPAVAEAFRQSSRTAAMIEVYERVLSGA
ncbi:MULTISPECIES: glycosyltransferase [unclassified Microbacterium]|uniref:glycosyltransferase n=1 Tax=unclassified Microbacterium TaxID=2609290 RepID=UPI0024699AC4|nr:MULTISPECIES: glycosyltransferase [unclassified Microbacterium]MDH5134193.1 glycosyltransferase [Microbacterium sp. RD10]MDH5137615.1 glycosyltransferase [Microbacterium sp. RD11]MDH5143805.1 glycosyltransferase [Microbacterium sp. RD12]MDH5154704.1 glycosyltransferase [Microbacterium sp. RD06]MDH5166230.1 glycosyltransferase [Microbacterium sp. RD02]